MPSQGVSTAIAYMVFNSTTGLYVSGDVANHTIMLLKDGTSASAFYNPSEISASVWPGGYRLGLSTTETTFSTVVVGGKTSTANCILIPMTITFEVLPTALDANGNVKADMEDIRGATVSTTVAQVGTNLVSVSGAVVSTTVAQIGTNLVSVSGTAVTTSIAQIGANLISVSGSAVTTSLAQIGVNVVNVGGSASAGVAGYFAPDWGHVTGQGTTVSLTNTTISPSQQVSFSGTFNANVVQIQGSTRAATQISVSGRTITSFIVGTGSTTSTIVTSSMDPANVGATQFKGKTVNFSGDTTTPSLRGQSTTINSDDGAGTLQVVALTTAPVNGDIGSIT